MAENKHVNTEGKKKSPKRKYILIGIGALLLAIIIFVAAFANNVINNPGAFFAGNATPTPAPTPQVTSTIAATAEVTAAPTPSPTPVQQMDADEEMYMMSDWSRMKNIVNVLLIYYFFIAYRYNITCRVYFHITRFTNNRVDSYLAFFGKKLYLLA